jgi:hypothetical protein
MIDSQSEVWSRKIGVGEPLPCQQSLSRLKFGEARRKERRQRFGLPLSRLYLFTIP